MNAGTITTIIGVLVALGGVFAWSLSPQRRRHARFADREELSAGDIYSQFFTTNNFPEELVSELWNEVAVPLRVPPGKLRPSDRFDMELAPVAGWEFDDDTLEVHWTAQRRLKQLGVNADLASIQTLRDYVEFFCKLHGTKA